jgi:hypothetical protein
VFYVSAADIVAIVGGFVIEGIAKGLVGTLGGGFAGRFVVGLAGEEGEEQEEQGQRMKDEG